MTVVRHFFKILVITCIGLFASVQADEGRPDKIIDVLTVQLLTAVEDAKDGFAENPEPFYALLQTLVIPHMDMRGFARGVMGEYGSTAYYRGLQTKAEREAFKARVLGFVDIFTDSVVRTYGKGLMTFDGQSIDRVPLTPEEEEMVATGRPLEIVQMIRSPGSDPHELRYSFARNKKGTWLARNILVDGINLGRVYQSQFSQAVKDNNGDVDAAVNGWSTDAAEGGGE